MLYQEVRPTKLSEFVGNQPVVTALKNVLDRKKDLSPDKHPHVFLFAGPSGCGKTTLARIMAHMLDCKDYNIIEKNTASERGIDMAREIEKCAQASPLGGGNRAVILDEIHRTTKDAQSALLKVLEDIPNFAYYFLCTTEPNKVLKTIHTRCQMMMLNRLGDDDIYNVLVEAADRAGMDGISKQVLEAIIENAEGCPRSAVGLLEKQAGLAEDKALEVIDQWQSIEKSLIDLCRKIINGQWKEVVGVYNRLEEKDPEAIRRCLLGYLKSCLLKAKGGEAGKFASMLEEAMTNIYDSGEPGLVAIMYRVNKVK